MPSAVAKLKLMPPAPAAALDVTVYTSVVVPALPSTIVGSLMVSVGNATAFSGANATPRKAVLAVAAAMVVSTVVLNAAL